MLAVSVCGITGGGYSPVMMILTLCFDSDNSTRSQSSLSIAYPPTVSPQVSRSPSAITDPTTTRSSPCTD